MSYKFKTTHLDHLWYLNSLFCQICTLSVERTERDKHLQNVCIRWVQALTDELVDDGHGGNGQVFTVPLCISLSSPSADLAFPLTSPLTSLWFLLPTFSLFCFLLCSLLSPWLGTFKIKPNRGLLSIYTCWNTVAILTLGRQGTLLRWLPHQM